RLVGQDSASAERDAALVLTFETALAQASLTRVERRDPSKTDHPMTRAQLDTLTRRLSWPVYFRAIGVRVPVTRVNVAAPQFIRRVDSVLGATPLGTWRAYLKARAIAEAAPWLSAPFVQEDFAFRARFSGARALLPRWKRC